jgi:renalase
VVNRIRQTECDDVAIVGAGIAGLSCADTLSAAGSRVVILDRSPGIGGRMATRRVEGQPVDHGVPFLHGASAKFRQLVESCGPVIAWPERVTGEGKPCQPKAFSPLQWRLAPRRGVSQVAKVLANRQQLRVQCETEITEILPEKDEITVQGANASIRAQTVVLALAHPQTLRLLRPLRSDPQVAPVVELLSSCRSLPVLTVIAMYPLELSPEWDLCYPRHSQLIHSISHDSSKRVDPKYLALVIHCLPRWSATHADQCKSAWGPQVLDELSQLLGPAFGTPHLVQFHRWRFARVGAECELQQPVVLNLAQGGRLALTGELFAPGGGAEAAFLAGCSLASRLIKV